MTRVLIVEDSATMRHHLREALAPDPQLEIIGEAADGLRAVQMTARLRPDVITMDMMLPGISGLAATEQIMAEHPTPILVVSSADREESFSTYNALAAGAVDVMEKPRGDDSDADWAMRLRTSLRLVARIRVITHPRARLDGRIPSAVPAAVPVPIPAAGGSLSVVAIGASTGGPAALTELLRTLPRNFHPPVLCVQHIAASEQFAEAFSDWLGGQTSRDVRYAVDGTPIGRCGGQILLAPPDRHLFVRDQLLRLSVGPPRHSCRPSVDVLFESVAEEFGPTAAGCLLTGMGRDGASGLLQMRGRGAVTFAQDEGSCTVYGMPREAALIGAAQHVLPPARIASRLGELHVMAVRR
ncbi:chemotaxis-specific protein-glutamate methyltransferase CheB [Actinoplanes utahensis]|uniref:Protein-glutamate methylesterase/protein-glutamine glutaminase n=1 Tax=Actinoplanes utahensis TaxID=1869 RepID=A0A0A6U813_ACTUT|nr:chemotaxis-specific protein-glutamate methyltransferase CheB [Actinoplanes utahensis]KHD72185.1 chemotaxis protein CheY [Actinoplanes utahensis]GIF27559.1 chemotaxis response regulator protein-glutamate methylesterase [Actinoplanes utahensis]